MSMSKQEEIKQALAAATPGPWVASGDAVRTSDDKWICQMYEGEYDCECDFSEFPNAKSNAGLIAKAPEYIAYLLEENERLRSALETTLFHLKKEYYMSAEDSIEEALAVGQEGEGNQDE